MRHVIPILFALFGLNNPIGATQPATRPALIFSVLAILTAAIWFWSMGFAPAGYKRNAPTPVTLCFGGVLIEHDSHRPGFGAFDRRWSTLGLSWHEYERLLDAPDHAPGAIPIPAAFTAGPHDRWCFVRTYQSWCIPLWPFVLAFGAIAMFQWAKHAGRSQRLRTGLCQQCGYDRRATPEKCPECGAVPAASRSEDSLSKSTNGV